MWKLKGLYTPLETTDQSTQQILDTCSVSFAAIRAPLARYHAEKEKHVAILNVRLSAVKTAKTELTAQLAAGVPAAEDRAGALGEN